MISGSRLERVLASGNFAVTSELGPPKSASAKGVTKHAAMLKDCSDGQNLTDNQTAIVRLSSIAAAVHVLAAGGDPIIQMTCRDRNRIALQSDLLGAASLGVKTVLCLTGDHQSFGNHGTAKNVFDLDSIQLIAAVKGLRDDKRFLCGEECKVEPKLFIGCAENPFADPFEFRVMRLEKKARAGADFVQTQAVFDVPRFAQWMEGVRSAGLHKRIHILGGVIPVKSAAALKYMATVPGMRIPAQLVKRMEGAADPEQEGVALCVEIIQQLRQIEGVAGVHIMAVYWETIVPEIVARAGLLPRP
ncbi:MAG: methylenetetrahydrofolate reductase [Bacillota bacterium]